MESGGKKMKIRRIIRNGRDELTIETDMGDFKLIGVGIVFKDKTFNLDDGERIDVLRAGEILARNFDVLSKIETTPYWIHDSHEEMKRRCLAKALKGEIPPEEALQHVQECETEVKEREEARRLLDIEENSWLEKQVGNAWVFVFRCDDHFCCILMRGDESIVRTTDDSLTAKKVLEQPERIEKLRTEEKALGCFFGGKKQRWIWAVLQGLCTEKGISKKALDSLRAQVLSHLV